LSRAQSLSWRFSVRKREWNPVVMIPWLVAVGALLLQGAACTYLLVVSSRALSATVQHLQIETARDLAGQLARALSGEDDLAALASLREARLLHSQLREAMLFDRSGRISLHTDAGMLGKQVPVPTGPLSTAPEVTPHFESGRSLTSILLSLPGHEDRFFQASFDRTQQAEISRSLSFRISVLSVLNAALLGALAWVWLRRYTWIDPRVPAIVPRPQAEAKAGTAYARRLAGLLLAELPHAALALDRDRHILAVNMLALELLNCRSEELTGMHLLSSPLPNALLEFCQTALTSPGKSSEAKLSLVAKAPAMTVTLTCSPASLEWELALVTLR
jgi:hypothetical protein